MSKVVDGPQAAKELGQTLDFQSGWGGNSLLSLMSISSSIRPGLGSDWQLAILLVARRG